MPLPERVLSAWFFPELPQLLRRGCSLQARVDFAQPALALAFCPFELGMDPEQPIQLRLGSSLSWGPDLLFSLATPARPESPRPRLGHRASFHDRCPALAPADPRHRGG